MAGYSGTPLWKKLGYKDGITAYFEGVSEKDRAELQLPAEHSVKWTKRVNRRGRFHTFVRVVEIYVEGEARVIPVCDRSGWNDMGVLAKEELGCCHRRYRRCGAPDCFATWTSRYKGLRRGRGLVWIKANDSKGAAVSGPNQAMQRTTGRSEFQLSMTTTSYLQPRPLSRSGR